MKYFTVQTNLRVLILSICLFSNVSAAVIIRDITGFNAIQVERIVIPNSIQDIDT